MRLVRGLLLAYLVVSVLTVLLEVLFLFVAPGLVTIQALVRTVIVAGFAVLMVVIANAAARGSAAAQLRLRIIVAVVAIAFVIVLFVLPLPLWVLIEQALCCALLVVVAILLFTRAGASRTR